MSVESQPMPQSRRKGLPVGIIVLGLLWLALGGYILFDQFSRPSVVNIEWATETEYDTAGYNIYRSDLPVGEFTQINDQLIPSQADPASGASYSYTDENVTAGETYYYKLEDVEFNGTREQHNDDIIKGKAPQLETWALILAVVSFVTGLALISSSLKGLI